MTLHWWIHWFSVTAHFAFIFVVFLPSTTIMAKSVMFVPRTTSSTEPSLRTDLRISIMKSSTEPTNSVDTLSWADPNFPNSSETEKHHPTTNRWEPSGPLPLTMFLPTFGIRNQQNRDLAESQNNLRILKTAQNVSRTKEEIFQTQNDTRITWIVSTSRPKRQKTNGEDKIDDKRRNSTSFEKDLTVRPLEIEQTRLKVVVNTSQTIKSNTELGSFKSRTLNRLKSFEVDRKVTEPRLFSQTASPVLQADIQEVTREKLNRARFSTVYQNDRAADRFSQKSFHEIDDDQTEFIAEKNTQNSSFTTLDIAAITGSCLVMVLLISTVTSLAFIVYRRKYSNPPQILNSDKSSNPDSSGYIDDSTIHDNSEEMYSLDNDSFLDSLEAMTIQNYWTDSVKHTKL